MQLTFQLLDADYILNAKPIIRLFGKTESGNPVCVFYDKFLPYFYVSPNEKTPGSLKAMKEVAGAEEKEMFSPLGFSDKQTKLLKITLTNPQDVPRIRDALLESKACDEVYEADILFKNRFMVDFGLRGMGWVEAECTKAPAQSVSVASYQAESVRPVAKEANADMRYLALDIECLPADARKPLDAKTNPIIMIALCFEPAFREQKSIVLAAKPAQGKGTLGFQNEKEMLEEFLSIVESYDPDIVTGYNINSFDLPYILERLAEHRLPRNFGRAKDKPVYSKKYGITQECTVPGRVVADPYQILRRDPWQKFHRYNLNTVAKELLGEEKLNVGYGDIPKLWSGSRDDLGMLTAYARKDAELSLRLVIEKGMLDKFFELSKISGILLQDCFFGQSSRVEMMLLYEFRKRNFVMPSKPGKAELAKRAKEREKVGLKGATVLEPKKGLHAEGCTLVLDFRSLYPSIMRSYNISTDTLLAGKRELETNVSPSGAEFAASAVREGIMPHVLTKLLDARASTKRTMKGTTGEKRKILNARQLALKDISNSIYGYTGYIRARLYMIDVANSITAYGRENIERTKKLIEEKFPVEVIYGDTDSILVKTNMTSPDEAQELGNKISKTISDELPGYLELEFEKIYRTFLILTKKRYAGWKFVWDGGWKDDIEMKGIETIRRDWCALVSKTMRNVIDIILKEGDIQKAIESMKEVLESIREGRVPLDDLTIIKGITKSIESYEGMSPHIELARKLNQRNPNDPVKIGDRLGYVIIKGNQLLSKRAEDPEYAQRNNLQIDSDYYIYSQLLPPVERILNAVGVTRGEVLGSGRQTNIMDIVTGSRRKMKHSIEVNVKKNELAGWEGFVCRKCSKSYRRMPLSGMCDCGGDVLISYQGSMGSRIVGRA